MARSTLRKEYRHGTLVAAYPLRHHRAHGLNHVRDRGALGLLPGQDRELPAHLAHHGSYRRKENDMRNTNLYLITGAVAAVLFMVLAFSASNDSAQRTVAAPTDTVRTVTPAKPLGGDDWSPGIGISTTGRIGLEVAPGIMIDSGGNVGFGTGF